MLGLDDGMKATCAVNLHNIITVSQSKLGKRVARLNAIRMEQFAVP